MAVYVYEPAGEVPTTPPGSSTPSNQTESYIGAYTSEILSIYDALVILNTHMGTVANNSTLTSTYMATIKEHLNSISEKITEMESHHQRIRELAEGEGIHMISPFELVSFITTYRRLIEEGGILKWRDAEPSDKEVSKALNDLGKYVDRVQRNIPRAF